MRQVKGRGGVILLKERPTPKTEWGGMYREGGCIGRGDV